VAVKWVAEEVLETLTLPFKTVIALVVVVVVVLLKE
jgi:hypothetical protein